MRKNNKNKGVQNIRGIIMVRAKEGLNSRNLEIYREKKAKGKWEIVVDGSGVAMEQEIT